MTIPMIQMPSRRMAGFSMVEVLVALVIGMLASIVVLQLFNNSENRNRTAAGSADAQSNGLMTLYQMQSQILRAGYGFNSISLFNCNVTWQVASGSSITKPIKLVPVAINPVDSAGVQIIPAGDANTDVLVVISGNGNSESEGNEILETNSAVYTVRTQSIFEVGDRVIAAPFSNSLGGTLCGTTALTIDRITASDPTSSKVTTLVGTAGKVLFNLGLGPNGLNATPTVAMPTNGPTILAYAVRNGNLTVCDFNVNDCSNDSNKSLISVWVPIASNIASMRAAYWRDNSADWNGATPTEIAIDQTLPNTACDWARVRAINLLLVARSDEKDKEIVTILNGSTKVSSTAELAKIANSAAPAPNWSIAALNNAPSQQ